MDQTPITDAESGKKSVQEEGVIINTITGEINDLKDVSLLPQIDPTQVEGLIDVLHYHSGKRVTRLEVWESKQAFDQARKSPFYQSQHHLISMVLSQVQIERGELIPSTYLQ